MLPTDCPFCGTTYRHPEAPSPDYNPRCASCCFHFSQALYANEQKHAAGPHWYLHASAIVRHAVPVNLAIVSNMHVGKDIEHPTAYMILPIDEVYGVTADPQLALEWTTIGDDSLEDWLDLHIPAQRRPRFKPAPAWKKQRDMPADAPRGDEKAETRPDPVDDQTGRTSDDA